MNCGGLTVHLNDFVREERRSLVYCVADTDVAVVGFEAKSSESFNGGFAVSACENYICSHIRLSRLSGKAVCSAAVHGNIYSAGYFFYVVYVEFLNNAGVECDIDASAYCSAHIDAVHLCDVVSEVN